MSNEVEIEFKNLLTEQEYTRLMSHFQASKDQCWVQENHYYDTPDLQLKKRHSALRIRVLPQTAEMTLKTPHGPHLLESTEPLSKETAFKIINNKKLVPLGDVAVKLAELGIEERSLEPITTLTTLRYEKQLADGLLVLDKSTYNEQTDFELELEVTDSIIGKRLFHSLLTQFSIPERPTPNKIHRAFNSR